MLNKFLDRFSKKDDFDPFRDGGYEEFLVSEEDWNGYPGLKFKLNKIPYRTGPLRARGYRSIEVPYDWARMAEAALGVPYGRAPQIVEVNVVGPGEEVIGEWAQEGGGS